MKNALSLALLTIASLGYGHDIKMAIFEISANGPELSMTVAIDKEDFLEIMQEEFPEAFAHRELKELASQYLDSKLSVEINGYCTSIHLHEIEYGALNIQLKGALAVPNAPIEEIQVTNRFMIDRVKDHDNIMRFKLNGKNRSFRLNSDRVSTIATYQ